MPPLTSRKSQDAARDAPNAAGMADLLATLDDLVRIPSVSGDAAACRAVVGYVQARARQWPGLHAWPFEFDGVPSLVVATRDSRRADLILNAHLDVVPARPEQFAPVHDGTAVRGRGVYDMKGAAAVYLALLDEVAGMPETQRPDLQVQFVTDEEVGGHQGARRLLEEGFTGGFFVAGEPTDFRICHRAKGILWLQVRMAGRPGHAAMPWQAENPVAAMHAGLGRLLERWPPPAAEVWRTTATPTVLWAGAAPNRVPEEAVLKLDVRRVPEDAAEAVIAEVRACFPGADVEVLQSGAVLDTPADHPRVRALAALQEAEVGAPPLLYGEHYGSDARYWSAAGVPAVCWGPRGGGMHADDEWLDAASLALYHRLVRRLAGLA